MSGRGAAHGYVADELTLEVAVTLDGVCHLIEALAELTELVITTKPRTSGEVAFLDRRGGVCNAANGTCDANGEVEAKNDGEHEGDGPGNEHGSEDFLVTWRAGVTNVPDDRDGGSRDEHRHGSREQKRSHDVDCKRERFLLAGLALVLHGRLGLLTSRFAVSGHLEAIADAVHGVNPTRVARVIADLGAEILHVAVDGALVTLEVVAEHLLDELHA